MLLSTAGALKTVLVTSAVAGEGKSVTAGNLAAVLAQLGKTVLVVDADLRKPRQHEIFRIPNRTGLVSFLTNQAELGDVLQQTLVENLQLVPSGPIPPQPSELLASDRMTQFLSAVRERFDIVVIDSPPVLPVADPAVLSSRTDGVLVCIGAGLAVREDAVACIDRLAMVEAKTLGVVLNRIQHGKGGYRGKNYHRYYSSKPSGAPHTVDVPHDA